MLTLLRAGAGAEGAAMLSYSFCRIPTLVHCYPLPTENHHIDRVGMLSESRPIPCCSSSYSNVANHSTNLIPSKLFSTEFRPSVPFLWDIMQTSHALILSVSFQPDRGPRFKSCPQLQSWEAESDENRIRIIYLLDRSGVWVLVGRRKGVSICVCNDPAMKFALLQ
jgi:hypothetical protein